MLLLMILSKVFMMLLLLVNKRHCRNLKVILKLLRAVFFLVVASDDVNICDKKWPYLGVLETSACRVFEGYYKIAYFSVEVIQPP